MIISYEEFVKTYQPIKNNYFPKAAFNGTLFDKPEFQFIMSHVPEKKIWSLFKKPYKVSDYTDEAMYTREILSGYYTQAEGYFATTSAYKEPTTVFVDKVK